MTLTLHIHLPRTPVVEAMLSQTNVPCFCRVKEIAHLNLSFRVRCQQRTAVSASVTMSAVILGLIDQPTISRLKVQQEGQVQPAFISVDAGDVAAP